MRRMTIRLKLLLATLSILLWAALSSAQYNATTRYIDPSVRAFTEGKTPEITPEQTQVRAPAHPTTRVAQARSTPNLEMATREMLSRELWSFEWSGAQAGDARDPSSWVYQGNSSPHARQKSASARLPEMRRLFKDAGVEWPPAELYLRAFKLEGELELWASSVIGEPLKPIITWQLCTLSGSIGPKRREGDGQVPEGFYKITGYNPRSRFHLSMRVNYPNRSDRILGHPRTPGSDIMIHGGCASIGCLAMTDARVEELWVITRAWRQAQVQHRTKNKKRARSSSLSITLYPTRRLSDLLALELNGDERKHLDLWRELSHAHSQFIDTHRPPVVHFDQRGRARLKR